MNTFKSILFRVICLACALDTSGAWANSNFVANPYLPYPPSCVRMPSNTATAADELGAVLVHEAVVQLPDLKTYEQVDFVLRAYRSPCHEAGRSLLWLQYSLTAEQANKDIQVLLPSAIADIPYYFGWSTYLIHASEPNSWGTHGRTDRQLLLSKPHGSQESYDHYDYLKQGRSWWFLMDVETPLLPVWENPPIPVDVYNARFTVELRYTGTQVLRFDVPATTEVKFPQQPEFPLTGRLSGTWVIENARDQGLMLAISSLVKQPEPNYTGFVEPYFDYPTPEMVLFYSLYTFDAQGKMLWLTGNTTFNPGSHQVTLPVIEASQGEFRGDQPAQRRTIGQVTLTANSCNDIRMDYDFSELGLGTGSKRLQRLFSLETAGYDCRDYAARVEANQ